MEFKDRISMLRKELNLTQEEFAKKIGFSRTAVSAWEIGRNEPSNNDTIKLADFFNVSTDYLLGKTDERNWNFEQRLENVNKIISSNIKEKKKLDINTKNLDK